MRFPRTTLGRTGLEVGPLGLGSSYGVAAKGVEWAFEQGVDYFYWASFRRYGFGEGIRNLSRYRDQYVLVVQSYSRLGLLVGFSVEQALRELKQDHADILVLGMWNEAPPPAILDAARKVRERGLARFLGLSTHHRPLVADLARESDFDVFHVRYNAVHRGAETEVFPKLPRRSPPGMVAYTATSWGRLLNTRRVPRNERVPTAADCYRFVLSQPAVNVCLCGPANMQELEHAVRAVRRGPMAEDELEWMRRVGAAIYNGNGLSASMTAP